MQSPEIQSPFCQNHPAVPSVRCSVIENTPLADRTFRIRLNAAEIAGRVRPGQFVMLRLPDRADPLLGRPLAVYRVLHGGFIEIVYLVVGKMTSRLAQVKADDALDIWGPLGNGFDTSGANKLIMVAGGIGQTPMLMLGEQFIRQHGPASAVLLYGARNKSRFSGVDDFQNSGITVHQATDDGSVGYHGPVTNLIAKVCHEMQSGSPPCSVKIVCCGPHPMLQSAFYVAKQLGLPCDVSLESPMACGMGICFSCVVEVSGEQTPDSWDYQRTCVDGPVFDAYRLKWST